MLVPTVQPFVTGHRVKLAEQSGFCAFQEVAEWSGSAGTFFSDL